MSTIGNLPPSTSVNSTANYFNNFFATGVTVTQNIDDAVIAFFESITGDTTTGRTLASAILYTALNQGLDPMVFVDELRKLKTGKRIEIRTPIDSEQFVGVFNSYQELDAAKDEYVTGQLFYIPSQNVFYKLNRNMSNNLTEIIAVTGYVAERIVLSNKEEVYNYFTLSYTQEQNELNAYLTLMLNLNRINTSLLGISNSPQTSKYIKRAILP